MKNFWSLVALVCILSGCGGRSIEFVRPPLQDPPLVKSVVADKNDKSGEDGVWMTWPDYQAEMLFNEHVRNVKKDWH